MATRQGRRDRRLANALGRFYEAWAARSVAVCAGSERLIDRRTQDCLAAGRDLAEVLTALYHSYRPPRRRRRPREPG